MKIKGENWRDILENIYRKTEQITTYRFTSQEREERDKDKYREKKQRTTVTKLDKSGRRKNKKPGRKIRREEKGKRSQSKTQTGRH